MIADNLSKAGWSCGCCCNSGFQRAKRSSLLMHIARKSDLAVVTWEPGETTIVLISAPEFVEHGSRLCVILCAGWNRP